MARAVGRCSNAKRSVADRRPSPHSTDRGALAQEIINLSLLSICARLARKHRSTNTVSLTAFDRYDGRIRTGQPAVPAFARRLRHPGVRPHQPGEGTRDSSPRQPLRGSGGRRRHVEPDASRGACPARRRLLRVKPSGMGSVLHPKNNPQLLSDGIGNPPRTLASGEPGRPGHAPARSLGTGSELSYLKR
jgi:hypothetical protein